MDISEITARIKSKIPDAQLQVEGEDCSFSLSVVSESFSSVPRVRRQQTILGLFSEDLARGDLHALSVKAYTPEEWKSVEKPQLTQLA